MTLGCSVSQCGLNHVSSMDIFVPLMAQTDKGTMKDVRCCQLRRFDMDHLRESCHTEITTAGQDWTFDGKFGC